MDKSELIKSLRKAIAEGEIETAYDQLTSYLEQQPDYRSLYQDSLQAQAQFNKAQNDAQMGVVSSEQAKLQFNQSTRQLLHLLERLEKGPAKRTRKNKLISILVIAAILVVGGGSAWWWLSFTDSGDDTVAVMDEDCPRFSKKSIFNILLLPFISLDESQKKPHIAISDDLARLKDQHKISCDIKTYNLNTTDPNAYPATNDDAGEIAQNCRAQLIIWGTSESINADSTTLNTRYKFLNAGNHLSLNKLELTEGTNTNTVTSISSISTGGLVTASIKESILLLFGLIAHETGNQQAAIDALKGFEPKDSASSLVSGMVLAENYLALNQEDEALTAYDQVLEAHPNYWLARNNRGILNYKKGNFVEATEDLSEVLATDSTNTRLLEARGDAYLKTEQLKEAREDYDKVQRIQGAATPAVREKLKEIDSKIKVEENIRAKAENVLRRNPDNVAALAQKAQTTKKLGDYDESIRASRAILAKDPKNAAAYANLLDVYRMKKDTLMVVETIQRAKRSSVDLKELDRLLPFQLERTTQFRRINLPIRD